MRLMAALLGASLLPEPVSHRRLWNGLKPVVVGASPMARRERERGGRRDEARGLLESTNKQLFIAGPSNWSPLVAFCRLFDVATGGDL